jgi:hypothetical protein
MKSIKNRQLITKFRTSDHGLQIQKQVVITKFPDTNLYQV